jgi:hypothetical protein
MPTNNSLPTVQPDQTAAIATLWESLSAVKRLYWRQRYNNWCLTVPESERLGVLNFFGRVLLASANGMCPLPEATFV